MRVSLVCPVRDDSAALGRLLAQVGARPDDAFEVIVAVSGAEDEELRRLKQAHASVAWVEAPAGRGPQMNAGAARAQGDWLWFVHADSCLPDGWLARFHDLDRDARIVGGSFAFALDSAAWQARLIEVLVRLRVWLFDLPYGDQGIFVRRAAFEHMGGFAPIPLMEDVEFVRRLEREGRLAHLKDRLVTSARRWEREGWFRRSARNLWTLAQYRLGVSPERLAARYYAKL